MRDAENIKDLIKLQPDFIGFIFYKKSSRHVSVFPKVTIPANIKKVGVFVNEPLEYILDIVTENGLDCVQLHGDESPEYCMSLGKMMQANIQIIKAFPVDATFDFEQLPAFEKSVDIFLFDTKGDKVGGNGVTFDWSLLEKNTSKKPFLLSGGIGENSVSKLRKFIKTSLSEYCIGWDVNSKFEIRPGFKNIDKIKEFKEQLV